MPGPATWPNSGGLQILSVGLGLDGVLIEGGGSLYPVNLAAAAGPSVLTTASRRSIVQRVSVGGEQPQDMNPVSFNLAVEAYLEADMWAFHRAAAAAKQVELFVDVPFVDVWHIPSFKAGQTISRSSRPSAWGISGVTSTTRPVAVLVDGVEQTLVGSPPVGGEARVADPGLGNHFEVETPSGLAGTELELRYVPQIQAVLSSFSRDVRQHNHYVFTVRVDEILTAAYDGATVV